MLQRRTMVAAAGGFLGIMAAVQLQWLAIRTWGDATCGDVVRDVAACAAPTPVATITLLGGMIGAATGAWLVHRARK